MGAERRQQQRQRGRPRPGEGEGGAGEREQPEAAGRDQPARPPLERSRSILPSMHEEDREEAIGINEELETAIGSNDGVALESAARELKELLFFVEGRR